MKHLSYTALAIQYDLQCPSVLFYQTFFGMLQVSDLIVIKAAAQKALWASLRNTLRSRSMHAELVFSVAGSKHVGTPHSSSNG